MLTKISHVWIVCLFCVCASACNKSQNEAQPKPTEQTTKPSPAPTAAPTPPTTAKTPPPAPKPTTPPPAPAKPTPPPAPKLTLLPLDPPDLKAITWTVADLPAFSLKIRIPEGSTINVNEYPPPQQDILIKGSKYANSDQLSIRPCYNDDCPSLESEEHNARNHYLKYEYESDMFKEGQGSQYAYAARVTSDDYAPILFTQIFYINAQGYKCFASLGQDQAAIVWQMKEACSSIIPETLGPSASAPLTTATISFGDDLNQFLIDAPTGSTASLDSPDFFIKAPTGLPTIRIRPASGWESADKFVAQAKDRTDNIFSEEILREVSQDPADKQFTLIYKTSFKPNTNHFARYTLNQRRRAGDFDYLCSADLLSKEDALRAKAICDTLRLK